MSRLPSLPPTQLEGDQKVFYDELSEIVARHFGDQFTTKSPTDSSFIGPFGVFTHTPTLGRPFFDLTVSLSKLPGLSTRLREVAILTVGAHFGAKYEIYAHERVAGHVGVESGIVERILKREKPVYFGGGAGADNGDTGGNGDRGGEMRKASVVYDVSRALLENIGPLDQELYDRAVESLGVEGTVALVQFVGFYAYTCVVLNGFDVRVPE